jgi:hypothetical protein
MLLGLTTYSHHLAFGRYGNSHPSNPIERFGFMDKVVRYGLDGLQIDPLHLPQTDPDYRDALREESDARRLFIEHGAMSVHPGAIRDGLLYCREVLGIQIPSGVLE